LAFGENREQWKRSFSFSLYFLGNSTFKKVKVAETERGRREELRLGSSPRRDWKLNYMSQSKLEPRSKPTQRRNGWWISFS